MAVDGASGEISLDFLPPDGTDSLAIVEAAWVAREAMAALTVYPGYLQTEAFWQDAAQGFSQTKYLGRITEL
jgi:hypothetical protein